MRQDFLYIIPVYNLCSSRDCYSSVIAASLLALLERIGYLDNEIVGCLDFFIL